MSNFTRRYQENTRLLNVAVKLVSLIMTVVLAYTCVYFTCNSTGVEGSSMQPVITNEDTVLINRFAYTLLKPRRFDVIAFTPNYKNTDRVLIKRIIGLPGEKVKIENGKVFINGKELENDKGLEDILIAGNAASEISLGQDQYFVLGDNRNNSSDSREPTIGNVRRDEIIGRAWLRTQPLTSFGLLR